MPRIPRLLMSETPTVYHDCLAYIDLNPVRANMVKRPEEYRWSSLGYHAQTNNQAGFLSLDLGMAEWGNRERGTTPEISGIRL